MYRALNGYLRHLSGNGFSRLPTRLICAALLALVLPLTTFAYTVVFRSGRRVQIPDNFTVTRLTLTYETAPGINITLLMSAIDIRATDRANNEPEGTILSSVDEKGSANPSTTQARQPRRELTQRDIEAGRRQREKSEQDYERRRIELGLPSLEDQRRRTAEETRRLGELAAQTHIEEVEAEAYWRSRSSQLRTEVAAL